MTVLIRSSGLGLAAKRGPVFGPIDFESSSRFTILVGPAGSGKTCLLLALAGRLKPSSGSAVVLQNELPGQAKAARRSTGIAGFAGIDGLEDSVSVGATIHERIRWESPWYSRVPHLTDADVRQILLPVFGETAIPTAKTVVWDLGEAEDLLLRIALATLSAPKLLVVDNIDQVHEHAARARVVERLGVLAEAGTTVILTTSTYESDLYSSLTVAHESISMHSVSTHSPQEQLA